MITKRGETQFAKKGEKYNDPPIIIGITSLGIEIDGDLIDWHDIFKGIAHQSKVDPNFKHELKEIIARL